MLTAQSPLAGIQKLRRKPLQPIKNISANIQIHDVGGAAKSNPKPSSEKERMETSPIGVISNKENPPIYATPTKEIGLADASLAEELSAIRKKLERMRLDKEKTEEMLGERDVSLGVWMKELEQRGQAQKMLENEVDRLFRLKELKFMKFTPIRSLREKEGEKKIKGGQLQDVRAEDMEESVGESSLPSPISESSEVITEE